MKIRYAEAIVESDAELEQAEHEHRGQKESVHVRVLRLLKSGQARTIAEAARLVGYSVPQVTRWWERYRTGGLAAVLQAPVYSGRPPRITPEALERLKAAMEQGQVCTIAQARTFVATQDQIMYPSISGMAKVLVRHHIRKKTGRRRHRKASPERQEAFKKTSPS